MHHFKYINGQLHGEQVDLNIIAETIGTPFYCYSTATLERHYRVFSNALTGLDHLICFAVKANSNQAVLKTLARLGSGMDVVSEGELRRALAAGVPSEKIAFSGVAKTDDEISFALSHDIFSFNVESEPELDAINAVATRLGKIANIAIRINPDVDAKTHKKISTGKAENKFGIAYERARDVYAHAARLPGLNANGIHMHIGSQITALDPFDNAFRLMRELVEDLRSRSHQIKHIDLGGGLGIPYGETDELPPHPEDYAKTIRAAIGDLDLKLIFEPGRLIAGNAGILVTKVIYTKTNALQSDGKTFLIVDAGMNDLIRPTLYEAYHDIIPVVEVSKNTERQKMDVVGPVCETGDFFAENRLMPTHKRGDLLAILSCGAYGAVQSSTYNSRLLIPEVLVKDDQFAVIRPRPSYQDLLDHDHLPSWLDGK